MRHLTRYPTAVLALSLSLLVGTRMAQALPVTPVGPFSGNISETWEGFPSGALSTTVSIMSGAASISNVEMEVFPPPPFGLGSSSAAQPIGVQAMAINDNLLSMTTITFASPTPSFGAYWATTTTGATPSDITVNFYDILDNPLDSVTFSYLQFGAGTLDWQGWTAASGEAFAKVEYSGIEIVIDSLQAFNSEAPEPSALLMLFVGAAGLIGYACVRRMRRGA